MLIFSIRPEMKQKSINQQNLHEAIEKMMHSVLKEMMLLFSVSLSILLYQSVLVQQPNVFFVISDDQSLAYLNKQ